LNHVESRVGFLARKSCTRAFADSGIGLIADGGDPNRVPRRDGKPTFWISGLPNPEFVALRRAIHYREYGQSRHFAEQDPPK